MVIFPRELDGGTSRVCLAEGVRLRRPPPLELRALTVDQEYWVAIEAFDESGVSRLSTAIPIR